MVNKWQIKKDPEQIKKEQIQKACDRYSRHLKNAIKRRLKKTSKTYYNSCCETPDRFQRFINSYVDSFIDKNNQRLEAFLENEHLTLLIKKYNAVQEMRDCLSQDDKMKSFKAALMIHRPILEERRGSKAVGFLKHIIERLTFGYATRFSIWNVRGKKLTTKLDKILDEKQNSHSKTHPPKPSHRNPH